ncbi:MAG: hypothetical protein DVB31_09495 [Verrucomicrobia bacterium]|nr:MAG: hypothetical protein DVB31_09495 [Verrucomicrobiota bacterium]
MKRIAGILALFALSTFAMLADDLAQLEGKWSAKKTSPEGKSYTQVIEIKKDKFKFRIVGANDEVALYAEGTVKVETSGPFNVVKFTDIKAGASESDTQSIGDDRASIYMLGEGTWTVASNMDKERRNYKPSLDLYTKSAK